MPSTPSLPSDSPYPTCGSNRKQRRRWCDGGGSASERQCLVMAAEAQGKGQCLCYQQERAHQPNPATVCRGGNVQFETEGAEQSRGRGHRASVQKVARQEGSTRSRVRRVPRRQSAPPRPRSHTRPWSGRKSAAQTPSARPCRQPRRPGRRFSCPAPPRTARPLYGIPDGRKERQRLSHEGSGNTMQRQCLTAAASAKFSVASQTTALRQWPLCQEGGAAAMAHSASSRAME